MDRRWLASPAAQVAALVVGLTLVASGCAPEVLTDINSEDAPTATPGTTPSTSLSPTTSAPPAVDPVTVRVTDTVATDIAIPWGLAALPDGTALVTSRDEHHLFRLAPGAGKVVDLGEIPGVESDGDDGGLLGVAVSRYYRTTKRIYLYYSTRTDNRIAYVTLQPGSPATLSEPRVVFSGIPHGTSNNGGRIVFGPDGMLYVGTGDAGVPALAQDLDSLGGKILRMTPTGRPAPGNPYPGSVVFSSGHRDVQGLAFTAEGRLHASEPADSTAGELNWIRPGRNYGWPDLQDAPGTTRPVATVDLAGSSFSGIASVGASVFAADLGGQRLWQLPLAGAGLAGEPSEFLSGDYGRLRSVIALDATHLLLSTSNTDGGLAPLPGDDRLLLVELDKG